MAFTIVAHIFAKDGQSQNLRGVLDALVPETRKEDGCITYDLHIDNQSELHFTMFEIWETEAHWEAHRETPHFLKFKEAAPDVIEDSTVYQLTKV